MGGCPYHHIQNFAVPGQSLGFISAKLFVRLKLVQNVMGFGFQGFGNKGKGFVKKFFQGPSKGCCKGGVYV